MGATMPYENVTSFVEAMETGIAAKAGWLYSTFVSDAARANWLSNQFPQLDIGPIRQILDTLELAANSAAAINAGVPTLDLSQVPIDPSITQPGIVRVDVVIKIPYPNDPSRTWTTHKIIDFPADADIADLQSFIEGSVVTEFDNLEPFQQFGLAPLPEGIGEEPDIQVQIISITRS
jgi:hypothetical protein